MKILREQRFGPVRSFELGYAPIGRPMMTVRCYHVEPVLIDTGPSHLRRQACEAVGELPVAQILLTHHHEDHSGNAAAIARQSGAIVRGHRLTARKLRRGFPIQPYQRVFWGRAEPVEVEPLSGPVSTAQGELVPVGTPGHSKDHLVYLDERRGWLFSGDLYLGDRIKFFRADERFDDQIRSLERVLELDFDALFCAHHPRPEGGKDHVARKLDFLVSLRDEALELSGRGLPDEEVIARLDPGQDRWIRWITLGNVSFGHMIRSALHGA